MPSSPRIGLALGSGAARGWSHIGVIRALERAGIVPEVVCGTSIGALVGAAYAAGRLDQLEEWLRRLTWSSIARDLIDWRMSGGLIQGAKLMDFFRTRFEDRGIEHLPKRFGCVATELTTGREVWLQEGSVLDAVRASIAMPGLLTPVLHRDRLLRSLSRTHAVALGGTFGAGRAHHQPQHHAGAHHAKPTGRRACRRAGAPAPVRHRRDGLPSRRRRRDRGRASGAAGDAVDQGVAGVAGVTAAAAIRPPRAARGHARSMGSARPES
jgi:hypothetical protein